MVIGFLVLMGLGVGSFLNLCIYRLPYGESILLPRSHCEHCQMQLQLLDLIPLFSYIFLRGRCRYCGQLLSRRHLGIELLTAGLFGMNGSIYGLDFNCLLGALCFTSLLLVIAFIDYDHGIILDSTLKVLLVFGAVYRFYFYPQAIGDGFTGLLLGGGVLFLIVVFSGGAMGFGDVKLAGTLGVWLGWKGMVVTLFSAFVLGGIVGGVLILLHLRSRKDEIPFGPFLAIGGLLALWYGAIWWEGYWQRGGLL